MKNLQLLGQMGLSELLTSTVESYLSDRDVRAPEWEIPPFGVNQFTPSAFNGKDFNIKVNFRSSIPARLGGLSYFAGAEKKDDRVLVPDLGSLTSIYDRPEDGKSLMPVCLLQLCRIGVIMYEWLDIPWLKDYYNFGFDHFSMTWRKIGVRGLLDCLLGNAGSFAIH
ncbi:hypothetical protein RND71_002390 [Anisodus tanguticus]|uniref:Uncharacterized protein n=1 Tax=Anisodus tanguticus TaxID=243964 RepID=A0AAE1VRY5_9SOLA|nr:hypothetical protein RND71_002390 [Anisodus tanguticus]